MSNVGETTFEASVVEAGIESAKDPRYTVGPQKRRLEERRAAGTVHDSIVSVG